MKSSASSSVVSVAMASATRDPAGTRRTTRASSELPISVCLRAASRAAVTASFRTCVKICELRTKWEDFAANGDLVNLQEEGTEDTDTVNTQYSSSVSSPDLESAEEGVDSIPPHDRNPDILSIGIVVVGIVLLTMIVVVLSKLCSPEKRLKMR